MKEETGPPNQVAVKADFHSVEFSERTELDTIPGDAKKTSRARSQIFS